MENKIKVSALVLCYNQRATVGRAIESVLAQHTDFGVEVIVGDDCSTDGTADAVRDYAARFPGRVRLISGDRNVGLVENYRRCLKAAAGEYVADCAGDDFWTDSDRLQVMAGMLDRAPGASAVFSDFEIAEGDSLRLGSDDACQGEMLHRERVPGDEVLLRALNHVGALPFFLSAGVYRREAAGDADELFSSGWLCEDVAVEAALGRAGDVLVYRKPTVRYHVTPDSISNSRSPEKMARFYLADLKMTACLAERYGVEQERLREFFRAKSDYLVTLAMRAGGRPGAGEISEALGAWRLAPGVKCRLKLSILKLMELCRKPN